MSRDSIFISYRRADSSGYAGRMRDHLVTWFGPNRIFMDVGILGGEDWVASIERALSGSGALLAVIGPSWTSPRLHDPNDRLRQELEAAMRLGVVVIPVLVADARMPREEDLPPSLRVVTRHQAVRLTDHGWDDDMRRLVERLQQVVAPAERRGEVEPDKPSPVRQLIGTVIVLAILAGMGFVIYQFIGLSELDGPSGFDAKITLSPTSGPPGTSVTVMGTGFPARTDINISLLGPVTETVSDPDGNFTVTFTVPDTPFVGIHEVWASGGAHSDTAQFTIVGAGGDLPAADRGSATSTTRAG